MDNDTIEICEEIEVLDQYGNVLYTHINEPYKESKASNTYNSNLHKKSSGNKILDSIQNLFLSIFRIFKSLLTTAFVVIVGGFSLIFGILTILISTFISILFVLLNRFFKRKH